MRMTFFLLICVCLTLHMDFTTSLVCDLNRIYAPNSGRCICDHGYVLDQNEECVKEKALLFPEDDLIIIGNVYLTKIMTVKFWFKYTFDLEYNYFLNINEKFEMKMGKDVSTQKHQIFIQGDYVKSGGVEENRQFTYSFGSELEDRITNQKWFSILLFHNFPQSIILRVNNEDNFSVKYEEINSYTDTAYIKDYDLNLISMGMNIGIIKNFEIYKGILQMNAQTLNYYLFGYELNKNCLLSLPLNESSGVVVKIKVPEIETEIANTFQWVEDNEGINLINNEFLFISNFDVNNSPVVKVIPESGVRSRTYGYQINYYDYFSDKFMDSYIIQNLNIGFYLKADENLTGSRVIFDWENIMTISLNSSYQITFFNLFTSDKVSYFLTVLNPNKWNFILIQIDIENATLMVFINTELLINLQVSIGTDYIQEFPVKSKITLFNSKVNYNLQNDEIVFKGQLRTLFVTFNTDILTFNNLDYYRNSPFMFSKLLYYFPFEHTHLNFIREQNSGVFDLNSETFTIFEEDLSGDISSCNKDSKFTTPSQGCQSISCGHINNCFSYSPNCSCNICQGLYVFGLTTNSCIFINNGNTGNIDPVPDPVPVPDPIPVPVTDPVTDPIPVPVPESCNFNINNNYFADNTYKQMIFEFGVTIEFTSLAIEITINSDLNYSKIFGINYNFSISQNKLILSFGKNPTYQLNSFLYLINQEVVMSKNDHQCKNQFINFKFIDNFGIINKNTLPDVQMVNTPSTYIDNEIVVDLIYQENSNKDIYEIANFDWVVNPVNPFKENIDYVVSQQSQMNFIFKIINNNSKNFQCDILFKISNSLKLEKAFTTNTSMLIREEDLKIVNASYSEDMNRLFLFFNFDCVLLNSDLIKIIKNSAECTFLKDSGLKLESEVIMNKNIMSLTLSKENSLIKNSSQLTTNFCFIFNPDVFKIDDNVIHSEVSYFNNKISLLPFFCKIENSFNVENKNYNTNFCNQVSIETKATSNNEIFKYTNKILKINNTEYIDKDKVLFDLENLKGENLQLNLTSLDIFKNSNTTYYNFDYNEYIKNNNLDLVISFSSNFNKLILSKLDYQENKINFDCFLIFIPRYELEFGSNPQCYLKGNEAVMVLDVDNKISKNFTLTESKVKIHLRSFIKINNCLIDRKDYEIFNLTFPLENISNNSIPSVIKLNYLNYFVNFKNGIENSENSDIANFDIELPSDLSLEIISTNILQFEYYICEDCMTLNSVYEYYDKISNIFVVKDNVSLLKDGFTLVKILNKTFDNKQIIISSNDLKIIKSKIIYLKITLNSQVYRNYSIGLIFYVNDDSNSIEKIKFNLDLSNNITIVNNLHYFFNLCTQNFNEEDSDDKFFCLEEGCYFYFNFPNKALAYFCDYNNYKVIFYTSSIFQYFDQYLCDEDTCDIYSDDFVAVKIKSDNKNYMKEDLQNFSNNYFTIRNSDYISMNSLITNPSNIEIIKYENCLDQENEYFRDLNSTKRVVDYLNRRKKNNDSGYIYLKVKNYNNVIKIDSLNSDLNLYENFYLDFNKIIVDNNNNLHFMMNLKNLNGQVSVQNFAKFINNVKNNNYFIYALNKNTHQIFIKEKLPSTLLIFDKTEDIIIDIKIHEDIIQQLTNQNQFTTLFLELGIGFELSDGFFYSIFKTSFIYNSINIEYYLFSSNSGLVLTNIQKEKFKIDLLLDFYPSDNYNKTFANSVSYTSDYISLVDWFEEEKFDLNLMINSINLQRFTLKLQQKSLLGDKNKLRTINKSNLNISDVHSDNSIINLLNGIYTSNYTFYLTNEKEISYVNYMDFSSYYFGICNSHCNNSCLYNNETNFYFECKDDEVQIQESSFNNLYLSDSFNTSISTQNLGKYLDSVYLLSKAFKIGNFRRVTNKTINDVLSIGNYISRSNVTLEVIFKYFKVINKLFEDPNDLSLNTFDCYIYNEVNSLLKSILKNNDSEINFLYNSGAPLYFNFTNLQFYHQKKIIIDPAKENIFADMNNIFNSSYFMNMTKDNNDLEDSFFTVEIYVFISNFHPLCQIKHPFSETIEMQLNFENKLNQKEEKVHINEMSFSLKENSMVEYLDEFINKMENNITLEEVLECKCDDYKENNNLTYLETHFENRTNKPIISKKDKKYHVSCQFDNLNRTFSLDQNSNQIVTIQNTIYLKRSNQLININLDLLSNSTEIFAQLTMEKLRNNICFLIYVIIFMFQLILGTFFLIFEKDNKTENDKRKSEFRVQASYLGKYIFKTVSMKNYTNYFQIYDVDKFEIFQQLKIKKLDYREFNKKVKVIIKDISKESCLEGNFSEREHLHIKKKDVNTVAIPVNIKIENENEPQYENSFHIVRILIHLFPFTCSIINIFCFIDPYRHKFLKLLNLNTKYMMSLFLTALFFNQNKEEMDGGSTIIRKVLISIISFIISMVTGKLMNLFLQRNSRFRFDAVNLEYKLNHFQNMVKKKNIKLCFFTSDEFYDYFNNLTVSYEENIKLRKKENEIKSAEKRLLRVILGVFFTISLWGFIFYYLVLFGFYFERDKVFEWLFSFLIAIFLDFTVNPVIKVLLVYSILRYFRNRSFKLKNEILRKYFEFYTLCL